jgi:HSP20 family molecular chaperone IbpA
MNPRTDPPVPRAIPGDRRLVAVRAFVLVAVVLVVAATVLLVLALRRPQAAPTPSPAAVPAESKTPAQPEPDPRINEYTCGNCWVVEVVAPWHKPDHHVAYNPHTRRPELIVSWTPPEGSSADAGKRYCRTECRPVAYTRTVVLPEGVSTPADSYKNGILTLSFPCPVLAPRSDN